MIGVPQGGPLSPLLGNIILNELDKELESRGLRYVRYADDCQIFVGTEKAANRVMANIKRYIEENLLLKVNITKSKVRRPNEIKYLGFGFYYDYQNYEYKAKPHEKAVKKLKEKIKKITSRNYGISMKVRYKKLRDLVQG